MQDLEIKERLLRIKHKILVMSGKGGVGKSSVATYISVALARNGKLSSHLGHCEEFAFIETMKGKIVKTELRNPPPHEPGVLPQWLYEQGAEVAIVGGMGESAQQLLKGNGIEVIMGAPMDSPESLANQYLTKSLVPGENRCDH